MSIVTNYNINGIDISNVFQEYIQFQTLFGFPSSFISVASDSSAIYLAGVTGIGNIYSNTVYLSSNGGLSWSTRLVETDLNCISINSSGQYLAMAASGGSIYVSNDYGSTWTKIAYSGILWNCIKVSSTGQYMVAATAGTQIYFSTNYGVNWSASSSANGYWFSFAMNDDATIIYATGGPGVYKSTNYGSSWVKIANYNGRSIACDSSATQILLGTYNQGLFLSKDSGTTWTNTNLPTTKNFTSVQYYAISSDRSGQYLVASNIMTGGSQSGNIYFSKNFGTNWKLLNGSAGNLSASSISSITNENSIIISSLGANGIFKYILPSISDVGYYINNLDLVNYFTPYVVNAIKAPTTGYLTSSGIDLSYIFKKNPNYIYYNATGIYTTTSDSSYNTILSFTSGSGSIQFVNSVGTVNCIVIGGGAGGTSGSDSDTTYGGDGGHGGGGGQTVTSNLNYIIGQTYSIIVGNGGQKGYWSGITRNAATQGNSSNIGSIVANGGAVNTGNGKTGNGGANGKDGGNGTNNDGGGGGGGYCSVPISPQGKGGNGGPNGGGNGGNGGAYGTSGRDGTSGTVNTGGGGGGGGGNGFNGTQIFAAGSGGDGGSGIVIVRFNI